MTNLFENLTEKEKLMYRYIEDETDQGKIQLEQSYDQIGEALNISGATVHRAIHKLRKLGILGVIPSTNKYESNKLNFYGIPNEEEQIDDIIQMVKTLNLNAERFQSVLHSKDEEITALRKENDDIFERHQLLLEEMDILRKAVKFDPEKIISSQALGDGTIAYLVKE